VLVDRILKEGLAPSVPWHETLKHIMTSVDANDYTFARVNRRFVGAGIYLPALYSEGMGGLVVGFDTSASMSQEEANQIAGEITAIFEDCNPEWVEVIYCDTHIHKTQRFERGDDIELQVVGGGGTSFEPVFDYANEVIIGENNERVACLIYFTDLGARFDRLEEPDYPVVWGVTIGNMSYADRVPFGDAIEVVV
jgi:predicted metal-dependent peptidase